MSKRTFITTTIPYVNAAPHIGFALELVQADVVARYQRLCGVDVRFQTGTDENAFKNVVSARARGVPVERLVDENSARFQSLTEVLDVSIDQFIRTTSAAHRKAVQAFLSRLRDGDLLQRSYEGLYCSGCEDFYVESELSGGRCPEHGFPAVRVAEENKFFRLSRYQQEVRELIATRRLHIIPEARELEVLRFIDRGLTDISISRDASRREHWGIPFPGDSSQVVYVWIDALINYLSGLGYPDEEDLTNYWQHATKVHLIGKNVWKFHAVYWPALLLSAGLPLPDQIIVHGFLTNDGRKISKSSGDAVDPRDYVQIFGVDAVRYFLLRHIRPFDDSDFAVTRLESAYKADLVNGLGNLVSRLTALCEVAGLSGVPDETFAGPPDGYHGHLANFRFDLALALLWEEITQLNRDIAAAKPWEDLERGNAPTARERLSQFAFRLATLNHWLSPFLPRTSDDIRRRLSEPLIRKDIPLFPRVLLPNAKPA